MKKRTKYRFARYGSIWAIVLIIAINTQLPKLKKFVDNFKNKNSNVAEISQFTQWKIPQGADGVTLNYHGFTLNYNTKKKNPNWVTWQLKKEWKNKDYKRPNFVQDKRITKSQQAQSSDFSRSGYDRGHIAPNADLELISQKAQIDSFYMTNISPQKPNLNREVWYKLEDKIRNYDRKKNKQLWIIAGPLFTNNNNTLKNEVQIPDAFWKVIIKKQKTSYKYSAFLMYQNSKSKNLSNYLINLNKLENLVGFNIAPQLSNQEKNQKPIIL